LLRVVHCWHLFRVFLNRPEALQRLPLFYLLSTLLPLLK